MHVSQSKYVGTYYGSRNLYLKALTCNDTSKCTSSTTWYIIIANNNFAWLHLFLTWKIGPGRIVDYS